MTKVYTIQVERQESWQFCIKMYISNDFFRHIYKSAYNVLIELKPNPGLILTLCLWNQAYVFLLESKLFY